MKGNYPLPPELKYEYYERKRFAATFDRMDLSLKFRSGVNGIGAIIIKWTDGIYNHDAHVKKIEEQMDLIDQLRQIYEKENRTFKNWDAAWMSINTKPADYEEYLELRPLALTFHSRIQDMRDSGERAAAEAEYTRFIELDSYCSKIYGAEAALNAARDRRDEARKNLVREETNLNILREEERKLAARISDDHVVADSRGEYISELFPNVHLGHILSTINGVPVEELPFNQVLDVIAGSRSPHNCVFRRYDYRTDPLTGEWLSLEELREKKVFVEDPRGTRIQFIKLASQGKLDAVKRALLSGEDVNAVDHSGCTAMHAAAVAGHFDVVDLLIKAGGTVDARDKNMMTPMLSCVRRKMHDMMRVLIKAGADKTCTDRINRGGLYFAVKSGDIGMVRNFLKLEGCGQADSLWGWIPLHVAANSGNLQLVELLYEEGSSIFRAAKDGRIPEQVARDAGHIECAEYLRDKRLTAPAQLVYRIEGSNSNIWIGEQDALHPKFIHETGMDAVLLYTSSDKKPKKTAAWMQSDEKVISSVVVRDGIDDEDETDSSWTAFSDTMQGLIDFLVGAQRENKHKGGAQILICDPTGYSTSPAALCAFLLLKYQINIKNGVELCKVARPIIDMSLSMRRGLELLQRRLEEKKLKRLNDRVRESPSLSCAF